MQRKKPPSFSGGRRTKKRKLKSTEVLKLSIVLRVRPTISFGACLVFMDAILFFAGPLFIAVF